MRDFFKKAFKDMKESAKAQHEVDKANMEATRVESKAQFEEATAMRDPEKRKAMMQEKRNAQIAEATERTAAAQKRMDDLK